MLNIKVSSNKTISIDSVSLLTAWSLCFHIVLLGVNSFFNRYIAHTTIDSIILYIIYAAISVLCIFDILRNRVSNRCFILYAIGIIVCMFSLVAYGSGSMQSYIRAFLLTVAPFVFIGSGIRNFDKLEKYLEIATYLAAIGSTLRVLLTLINLEYVHDMTSAYDLLPCFLMSVYYAFEKKKILNIAIMAGMLIELIVFGVRGPIILAIIGFVILSLFFSSSRRTKASAVLIGVIALLISLNWEAIIYSFSNILSSFGIRNGALYRFLSGDFFGANNRDNIATIIMNSISENPILGYGLFYDRIVLNGSYAHNLFLELWLNFGVILGSLIGIAFTYKSIRLIINTRRNRFIFTFVFSLFVLSFGQLMISGSYLINTQFFLLIGLMCNPMLRDMLCSNNQGES